MTTDMNALDDNGTQNLVGLSYGKWAIGCKWVFMVKVNSDGSVARLKLQFFRKGHAQTYDINYVDIFSSVAKLTYVSLFISMAYNHNLHLHQLDVKNAFLSVRSIRSNLLVLLLRGDPIKLVIITDLYVVQNKFSGFVYWI